MSGAMQWTSQRGVGDRLVPPLCLGAIGIGLTVLIGYALGNASIAALGTNGKPAAAVSALGFIVIGAGLLALRWPPLAGLLTPRRAALAAIAIAAASLLSAALSQNSEEWQGWAARGGVYFHAFPVSALLLLALGSTLALVTTRWNLAGHLIASAVLLVCIVFLFGYVLRVPSFLNPLGRLAPVAVTTGGLALLAAAAVLVRPRGWVVPLLSRTSAGAMSRVLLLAVFIVPFLANALRDLIAGMGWFTPDVDVAVVVDLAEVFLSAAAVISAGALVYRHEHDRLRLASIVELSDDAIIGTSRVGLIESWNAGAERMYGYTAAEVLGRSVTVIAPPEGQHEAPRILERLGRGERVAPFETVRVAKDGHPVDVLVSVSAALDDAGNVVGASAIAHDITKRRKAEEALAESEARYRTLVENLPQKIILKDRHSVYVSANDAYARDLGVDAGAVAGKTDYDFFPRDLAEKYRADDVRIMEAGVTEDLEEEYVERGQRRFIHTVKTPVRDPQGIVTHILVILWDITEKKLAEERLTKAMAELGRFNRELAKSEAALKEAQRIAKIGHWDMSMVTGAVNWSDEHYRILGIPIGSVSPSHELLLSMMDAKSRRREVEAVARALATSDDANAETEIDLRVTTPAGVSLVLSQRVFVDRDDAGKVVGFHGTLQDITQRVATQQALRDSEAALAEAQEIAHIGSWVTDPKSGEVHASAETLRIFGLDPAPVVPLERFVERIHEEDRARAQAAIAASFRTGIQDLEFRVVTPHGTRVVHSIARRREAGEPNSSMIGTTRDITEEKAAEEALRQQTVVLERMMEDAVDAARSLEHANRNLQLQIVETKRSDEAHRRLATVVEQSAESIFITELDGTITYVNPAFERISGYTEAEAIGQNPRIFASGRQTAEFYRDLWAKIGEGGVWQGHFTNRRKDGTPYEEEATISPVRNASGTIINYVAIKRDVTAEMALEEQLRHSQKIEAIGTLAGGVAHDFNNLLQAMLSVVQLLKRKSVEPRDVALLTQLEKTIRRGSSLTQQLLLFARRETSKSASLDLNQLLRDLLDFFHRITPANIHLSIEPPSAPCWIRADRGQVEQVVMNLAVNAIDAMPEGGALSISTGRGDHTAWLEVADTGTGIPQANRDRIFEPFFTTKEAGKGTGLGLSVVYGIVTAHGGTIAVDCPEEGGTVFRVELPLKEVAAPLPAPLEEEVPNGSGERVLLVEDDPAAREGVAAILEILGYTVLAVGSGEEALGIDRTVPVSVVLTDYMLPGIPGIEVVRGLQRRWPDIKAIMMSGYAPQGAIEAAVATKEIRFLQKPFDMAALARALSEALHSSDSPDRP